MSIEEAIQQKTFISEGHKAHINILFTAAWMTRNCNEVLKPLGLNIQKFNVLRILRGQHGKPITIKAITARMTDRMSNSSRLVDALEAKGFVDRLPCHDDARKVAVFITEKGLELIENASNLLEKNECSTLNKISDEQKMQLNAILDAIRAE